MAALEAETEILISAGTVAEALVVSAMRNVGEEMARLIDGLGFDVVSRPRRGTPRRRRVCTMGQGQPSCGPQLGDCFAYEVAKHHACPLLYVGRDFARPDVRSAI